MMINIIVVLAFAITGMAMFVVVALLVCGFLDVSEGDDLLPSATEHRIWNVETADWHITKEIKNEQEKGN